MSFWVWPFYLALVIFGSFFMINLALAVLSINFSTDNFKEEQHAKEAEQNERRWLSGDEGEAQSQSGPSIAVGPGALGSVTGALMLQPQGQSQGQPQASAESEEKLNAMLLLQARVSAGRCGRHGCMERILMRIQRVYSVLACARLKHSVAPCLYRSTSATRLTQMRRKWHLARRRLRDWGPCGARRGACPSAAGWRS